MAAQSQNTSAITPPSTPQPYSSLPHRHTRREMKEYVVTEAELDQISLLNTMASGFFSAASAAASFAVSLFASAAVQGSLTEGATVFVHTGEIVGGILASGFAIAGFVALRKKRSKVSDIRSQAIPIDQVSAIPTPPPTVSQSTPDMGGSGTEEVL